MRSTPTLDNDILERGGAPLSAAERRVQHLTARGSRTAAEAMDQSIRPISPGEFARFQRLIHREAGIFLSEHKTALLTGRLSRRLRALGLRSFAAYYDYLLEPANDGERRRMLDCICTNETHFFREPGHWEFLRANVYPQWRAAAASKLRTRRIRAWSAACSTGEEPYSLAMDLLHHFPVESGWQIEILATDLSTKALASAQEGVWQLDRACEIPRQFLKEFMLKGVGAQQGFMKVGPAIRSLVEFRRVNLNAKAYPVSGFFDLIFCRNVLIYFDVPTKQAVLDRLLGHLASDGYLFLGHSESTNMLRDRTCSVGTAIFQITQHHERA